MNAITHGNWTGLLGMGLAPRELEATLHAANDLTQKEIARLMGISPKTVEKRIEDARFKLGAKTMRRLVLNPPRRNANLDLPFATTAPANAHCMVVAEHSMYRHQ